MAKEPEKLLLPPFPELTWEQFFWTGKMTLSAWSGFQSRGGPYGSQNGKTQSDGSVKISVTPEGEDRTNITSGQIAACAYLVAHQADMAAAALERIFEKYPEWREEYGFEEDEGEFMPEIDAPADLKKLIGLHQVHFLTVEKEGIGYIGFEFGCTWDDEHGLGVMMQQDRVVEVGGADNSFSHWAAVRHKEGKKK